MRKRICSLSVLGVCLAFVLCGKAHGWGITYAHPAFTQCAEEGSELASYCEKLLIDWDLTWDFNDWDPTITERLKEAKESLVTTRTISEWIRAGCKIEDTRLKVEGRSSHHFHDPLRDAGWDNREAANWRGDIVGFLVLAGSNCPLNGFSAWLWARAYYPGRNYHSWEIARACLYVGLIAAEPSDRDEYLAASFMSLGHTLHMIEDMGVPPHARNDWLTAHTQRVRWADTIEGSFGNPFEHWVEGQIADSSEGAELEEGSEGALVLSDDEDPDGNHWVDPDNEAIYFPKLADYWDAEEYTASNCDSFSGEPSSNSWGLAERTNYQFLSNTTIFLQDPKGLNGSRYYFPHPDKANTTAFYEGLIDPLIFRSGYGVTHLVRIGYLDDHGTDPTTFDKHVYKDYANVTIPRTIKYTKGLINYFCRGDLEVSIDECDGLETTIKIKNLSRFNTGSSYVDQQLKGGSWSLYWDEPNDYRRPVGSPDWPFKVRESGSCRYARASTSRR